MTIIEKEVGPPIEMADCIDQAKGLGQFEALGPEIYRIGASVTPAARLETYPDLDVFHHLSQAVRAWDKFVEKDVLGDKRLPFSLLMTEEEVATHLEEYIARLKKLVDIFSADGNLVVGAPMYGAAEIYEGLKRKATKDEKDIGDLIYPFFIQTSDGTGLGKARLISVPRQLKNPGNLVLLPDDVGDSVESVLTLAYQKVENPQKYSEFMRNFRAFKDAGGRCETDEAVTLYGQAAELFRDARVVFAPLFSKNRAIEKALIRKSKEEYECPGGDRKWAELQRYVIENSKQFEQNQWLIGGGVDGPLLDTKIGGKFLLEVGKKTGLITADLMARLIGAGVDDMAFRLGATIGPLIQYNLAADPTGYQQMVESFVPYVAAVAEKIEI